MEGSAIKTYEIIFEQDECHEYVIVKSIKEKKWVKGAFIKGLPEHSRDSIRKDLIKDLKEKLKEL